MRNSYHGRSFSAVGITGNRGWSPTALSPLQALYVHGGVRTRGPFAHLDDAAFVAACVDDLKDLLGHTRAPAALIAEPVQGVGGFTSPPDGLYGAFREVLDERGVLGKLHPQGFAQSVGESWTASIQFIEAAGRREEVEAVARRIVALCRSENERVPALLNWRDVGVLARSLAPYSDLVRETFARFEIPCFVEHPTYAQADPTGYGVKVCEVTKPPAGVAQLCPNAWMRTWSNSLLPPDGWSVGAFAIAQNSNPSYGRYGPYLLQFDNNGHSSGLYIRTPVMPINVPSGGARASGQCAARPAQRRP